MNIYKEIKERINIFDFVSDYVNLNSSKQGFCPFHNNTNTPSFSVSISKNMWSCFGGCGSGDVITFYEKIEGITHQEAVKNLAERLNLNYKSLSAEELEKQRKEKEKRELLIKVHEQAVLFYHEQLKENKHALEYLINRGLTVETIDKFKLGYAPSGFTALSNHLKDKFTKEDLLSSKLIKEKLTLHDTFINRVMIPITDTSGNPIAFGGRALNSEDVKYINSSESEIYSKSDNLYNYSWAKKYEDIILVEGYMDVIKPYQQGIKNIVASLGTSLTENQAKLLLNHKKIIIAYDNDLAGVKATKKAVEVIKEVAKKLYKKIDIDFELKILTQDKTKDLDEFLNLYSADELMNYIEKSKDYKEIEVTEILESKYKNQVELNHYLRSYLRSLDETIKEDLYKTVISPFMKKHKRFKSIYEKHHFFTKVFRKALGLSQLFETINKDPEIEDINTIGNDLNDFSLSFDKLRQDIKEGIINPKSAPQEEVKQEIEQINIDVSLLTIDTKTEAKCIRYFLSTDELEKDSYYIKKNLQEVKINELQQYIQDFKKANLENIIDIARNLYKDTSFRLVNTLKLTCNEYISFKNKEMSLLYYCLYKIFDTIVNQGIEINNKDQIIELIEAVK